MIFASGSCGLVQSSFDPFFFRFRSNRASSARVGVAMPDASASRVSHASYSAKSRNCRMLSESAARYAMARSESKPSK